LEAVSVKFEKDRPACLAVRKNLHPDIAALYVYEPEGALVYRYAEVSIVPPVSMAAVPAGPDGTEKLLVVQRKDFEDRVIEYSLGR
jgi:hypothetical protein